MAAAVTGSSAKTHLGSVPVFDQVDEPLRVGVVGTGLTVDEAEKSLASRAEEVVAAI